MAVILVSPIGSRGLLFNVFLVVFLGTEKIRGGFDGHKFPLASLLVTGLLCQLSLFLGMVKNSGPVLRRTPRGGIVDLEKVV